MVRVPEGLEPKPTKETLAGRVSLTTTLEAVFPVTLRLMV